MDHVRLEEQGFRDRRDAGRRLIAKLEHFRARPATVVLGLPRGGVVPAAEIAAALELPLDVIISRKIGAPGNPELAIGAVAEDGAPYLSTEGLAFTNASQAYVDQEVQRQRGEITRRREWFRGGKPLALPKQATVILVDDGIATGATAIAATRALRELNVARIVLAVPVAPPDTVEAMRALVDEIVILATPAMFGAVGAFYRDFAPVSDEEVCRLLAGARHARPSSPGAGVAEAGATPDIDVTIRAGAVVLPGILAIPPAATGVVVFAHGSGSGRFSPRNAHVAHVLRGGGFATLLLDLLPDADAADQDKIFDVALLAERLRAAAHWLRNNEPTKALEIGYFGASTGAAAALMAASSDATIRALVSRGGRPDLANAVLPNVTAPTLLIVGGDDHVVLRLNKEALAALRCEKQLQIIPGTGHLFEEPGALDHMAQLARAWFKRHLDASKRPVPRRAAGRAGTPQRRKQV